MLQAALYISILSGILASYGFKEDHMKNSRVKEAYTQKYATVEKLLDARKLKANDLHIFIRAFKEEDELEIWGKSKSGSEYVRIQTYSVCSKSGSPGPKRRSGDGQVPEGLYHLEEWRFNPVSSFWLSLGINYPNASDKVLSDRKKPGGDIYIHGECVTIGCLPMTNDKIKEIYILAVEARNNGQKNIPVHIFPFRMSDQNFSRFSAKYPTHKDFWENLRTFYASFEKTKKVPSFAVDQKGKYLIK